MAGRNVKKKYATVFNKSYSEEFPCITSSRKGNTFAFCTLCCTDFSILHRGKGDIVAHVNRQKHQEMAKTTKDNKKIEVIQVDYSVIRAESLFTSFIVEHNLPVSVADHAGPLFRKMFPDSEIAKKYGCARTKTTSIIGEMAKKEKQSLVEVLQKTPFSVSTDGSNKSDMKLYPLVITYHNMDKEKIETSLLSVPVLEGDATGQNIARLILDELKANSIPTENCLSLGADNAPVMIGKKAGVAAVLKNELPHLFVQGCLCHLIDLAAEKGASCLPVKVEEYIIDVYYYLEKSSKRKEKLQKFQELFDVETRKILKHVSTRWLSLGRSLARIVQQWDPLTSFFKEEVQKGANFPCSNLQEFTIPKKTTAKLNTGASASSNSESKESKDSGLKKKRMNSDLPAAKKQKLSLHNQHSPKNILSREERLFMFFSSDLNKAFALFLLNTLPLFEKQNESLQTNDPKIHMLRSFLLELFKSVLSRFVVPSAVKSNYPLDVDFYCRQNQKKDSELVIGEATVKLVTKLSAADQNQFYESVREYFVKICHYMRHKFPFSEEVLVHSSVANLDTISEASFESVRFFINRFPGFVKVLDVNDKESLIDDLQIQFCALQIEEIPECIKVEEKMDVKWAKLANANEKYAKLCKFMLGLLCIPHSNAQCERIFSLVTKTMTQFRPSLNRQNLENLLTVKSNMSKPCFEHVFERDFLKVAKSAAHMANTNKNAL